MELEDDISEQCEIERVFSIIKEITCRCIGEKNAAFVGISDAEIESLEQLNKNSLPKAYRLFLQKFAGGQLKIFDGQLYDVESIAVAKEVSEELLAQDATTLPDNSFVFSQWQGYQFFFFENTGVDNPETFLYSEGGNDLSVRPPKIYLAGCFIDWILNLAINSLTLQARLYNYKVESGIKILNTLLTNRIIK